MYIPAPSPHHLCPKQQGMLQTSGILTSAYQGHPPSIGHCPLPWSHTKQCCLLRLPSHQFTKAFTDFRAPQFHASLPAFPAESTILSNRREWNPQGKPETESDSSCGLAETAAERVGLGFGVQRKEVILFDSVQSDYIQGKKEIV